jgi:predicted nucleic acid-binding protein
MTGKIKSLVLLDNTVLSNFANIQRPALIRKALGDSAATVQEVIDELNVGVERGAIPDVDWSWLPIISMTDDERHAYRTLLKRLNEGEASCLIVASARGGRVLTDDRDARKIAMEMQISVSGTLGILVLLVDLGHISMQEADELLKLMIEKGYFSPIRSLVEIL